MHIRTNLATKMGMAVAMIILVAVVATTLLNALRFDQIYSQFIQRRLDVILADIRRDVVVGLDLGLPLNGIENLPAILARHARGDAEIVSITVHDCQGLSVATAGRVDASFTPWTAFPGQDSWQLFSKTGVAAGRRVHDAFGQCAGGISVSYDAAEYRATLARTNRLLFGAGGLSLLVIIPAMLAVHAIFRRRRVVFAALEDDVDRLIRAQGADDGPDRLEHSDSDPDKALVESYRHARLALAHGLRDAAQDGKAAP